VNTVVYHTGTFRSVDPAETWHHVAPILPKVGITRLAEITQLDEIGLPVHVAYRPSSRTYTVSLGTGATTFQSRVSAVMESIELWHAENLNLPVSERAPAAALDLGYNVRSLDLAPRSPLTSNVTLDWVAGTGILSARTFLAPAELIRLDFTNPPDWDRIFFRPTSNGLASGNTAAEAALHGLLEVVERDCIAEHAEAAEAGRGEPRYVDPEGCRNPHTLRILDALRNVGCVVVVEDITGRMQLPCYSATVWSPDVPIRCSGSGCHVDRGIAIGRALAEAMQSRLAMISGARDDVDADMYREVPPPAAGHPAELADDGESPPGQQDLDAVLSECARRVLAATGTEPFLVILDREEIGIRVVKVMAPGLRMAGLRRRTPIVPTAAAPRSGSPDTRRADRG
jgi:YcaO-like protein with predicted kinase domain